MTLKQTFKHLLLVLVFTYGLTSFSQVTSEISNFEKYYPPINSPNASAFGRYGEIPVNYSKGLPQIQIPIGEVSTNSGFSFPINVSYHASGIKVSDAASTVGLGWSLNFGGGISINVNGVPDFMALDLHTLISPTDINTFFNDVLSINCQSTLNQNYEYAKDVAINGLYDGEPDIYYYNLPSISGKFIKINGRIEQIPNNSIQITQPDNFHYNFVDERGNNYFLTLSGMSTSNSTCPESAKAVANRSRPTGYRLDSIVTPNRETIRYEYDLNTYTYRSSRIQTKQLNFSFENLSTCQNIQNTDCYIDATISEPIVTKISYPKGEISFTYSDDPAFYIENQLQRKDISGAKALRKISFKDKNGTIVKDAVLNYAYFGNNEDNYRLKLTDVTVNGDKHSFEYNETFTLPEKTSFKQDHWGYYDDDAASLFESNSLDEFSLSKDADSVRARTYSLKKIYYPTGGHTDFELESNTHFIPGPVYKPTQELFTVSSNQNSGFFGTADFILPPEVTSISDFRVIVSDPCSTASNGTTVTGQACQMKVLIKGDDGQFYGGYQYPNGSGQYSADVNISSVSGLDQSNAREFRLESVNLNGDGCNCQISMEWTNPKGTLLGENLNFPINGLRIKKLNNYDSNDDLISTKEFSYNIPGTNNSSLTGFIHPTYQTRFSQQKPHVEFPSLTVECEYESQSSNSSPLFGNNDPNDYEYLYVTEKNTTPMGENNGMVVYEYLDFSSTAYAGQNPGNSYDWVKGLLHKQTFFDKNSTKQREVINEYDFDNNFSSQSPFNLTFYNNVVGTAIKVSVTGSIYCGLGGSVTAFDLDAYNFTSGWIKLANTTTIDYLSSPVVIEDQFIYNNLNQQIKSKKTIRDASDYSEIRYFYADDIDSLQNFSSSEVLAVQLLNSSNSHRIAEPIQIDFFEKNNKVGTQRTSYNSFSNGFILPSTIQVSKDKPSSELEKRISFLNYDDFGNPLEINREDGISTYYVWGYNHSYPIAKIDNFTSLQAATVQSYVNQAVDASNVDADRCKLSTCKEEIMRTKLKTLRERPELSKAMITTYTYDPLIGVTSITGPGGYTTYYTYDPQNRLEYIEDKEGKVLQQYNYHYQLPELIASTAASASSVASGSAVSFTTTAAGGSGNFSYKWTVSNATLNQVTTTSTGSFSVTATASHAPSFTLTCEVTDTQTGEKVTTSKQVTVSVSFPSLSVGNIAVSPSGISKSVGQSVQYSIAVSGGSGNYRYQWSKTNSQGTINYTNNTPVFTNTVVSSDCFSFTIKCIVTDLTTNQSITKTIDISVLTGCGLGF